MRHIGSIRRQQQQLFTPFSSSINPLLFFSRTVSLRQLTLLSVLVTCGVGYSNVFERMIRIISFYRIVRTTYPACECVHVRSKATSPEIISGCLLPSLPFLYFPSLLPFSLSFTRLKVALKPSLEMIWRALLASPPGESEICSHQTRSLDSKYTRNAFVSELWPKNAFLVYLEPKERVCWLQMSSHFRSTISWKIEANVVISECSICYRVVAYKIIGDDFSTFWFGMY